MTKPDDPLPAKILAYKRANRAAAVLCNHQSAFSKNHGTQMEKANQKVVDKRKVVDEVVAKEAKKELKASKTQTERLKEQLAELEMNLLDKEEGKNFTMVYN